MKDQVLLLCGSMKPAPGVESKSATRQFIQLVKRGLSDHGCSDCKVMDLRDLTLPFYDGRDAGEYKCKDLDELRSAMLSYEHLVVSAPAYWRSAAGGLINAINLVGGPLYDFPEGANLLKGKKIHLIVTGAEYADAVYGAIQLRSMFGSMGAAVHPREILVGDLRKSSDEERKQIAKQLYGVGGELAQLLQYT